MKDSRELKKGRLPILMLIPALITAGILLIFFYREGFVPFGGRSFVVMDARIQYLDFFAYLKDVLEGHNDLKYSFSIGLGQSGIGTFSYYLSSPFNLLLLFFRKEQLVLFFDLVVVLKLCTAAAVMSFYLQKRFSGRIHPCLVIILSCAYALMQFNIAQASNIMWLDGVYMLPLMMLGVYRVVRQGRMGLLSVSAALSVLFCWYTAGINCLFSAFWFLFEYAQGREEASGPRETFFFPAFRYTAAMLSGLLMSCALFYPAVRAMREGKGAAFDWGMLSPGFRGNPLQIILNYSLGGISSENGGVSFYCGSVVLIGCIGVLILSCREKKKLYCVMLLFITAMCYWKPLYAAFSLMKYVNSYWIRFAYTCIFALVFMAASFFSRLRETRTEVPLVMAGFAYAACLFLLNMISNTYDTDRIWYSAAAAVLTAFLLSCRTLKGKQGLRSAVYACLLLLSVWELYWNTEYLGMRYSGDENAGYMAYTLAEEEQIRAIQSNDTEGFYRISQTSDRIMKEGNLTANLNEAMAYHYYGTGSYTSSPHNNQLVFLNGGGYREEGGCMSIVTTANIPLDALLGVKYILSEREIQGLELLENIPAAGEKKAWENPCVFPAAFVYRPQGTHPEYEDNHFTYVNALFGELSDGNTELFTAVPYSENRTGNTRIEYRFEDLDPGQTLYGNLAWRTNVEADIDVNGAYDQKYACWLSPGIFDIPVSGNTAGLVLEAEDTAGIGEGRFYAFHPERLEELREQLDTSKADPRIFENGHIVIDVVGAETGEHLFLAVPFDRGWEVRVNGQPAEPALFADTLYSIPLTEGESVVELDYHIPGLRMGILLSAAGLALLLAELLLQRKREKKEG